MRRDTVRSSSPATTPMPYPAGYASCMASGAQIDQAQRIRVGKRTSRNCCGECAHRVSCHEVRCAAFFDQYPGGDDTVNEQSELRGDGRAEPRGCLGRGAVHGRVPRLHV